MNFIKGIKRIDELEGALTKIDKLKFNSYVSNTKNILKYIEEFIDKV